MNPDTKITLAQLKAICARHGIAYHSHRRITTGFSHEVHRLNDDLILKLFNTSDSRRFRTERALLDSDLSFLKPTLIASGEADSEIDRDYIVMTFVAGKSLGSCWHVATDTQRENLIFEISESLKIINQIHPADVGLETSDSWEMSINKRATDLVAKLQAKQIIDNPIAQKVRRTFAKYSDLLSGTKLYPVYWDVHFDNFIVNDDFKLQALIDLENVELTSLDYPLFVIQKQTDEPEKFLREEDERFASKKDYAQLKGWYRKYYPEMFAFARLDDRLRLYQLLDTLHLLVDWSHVKGLYVKLETLTS